MTEETVIINRESMLPVGTLLQGGKYRIERHLSSGGFGKTSRYDTRNYDLVITADGKKEEEIAEYILQFLE